MVDTWAATAAGAFALTENNLYTVEAFHDYLGRLTADGMLSMTRWSQNPPDQLLRLVSIARVALAGARERPTPARHLMLVRGRPEDGQQLATATFLLKKTPFTDAEIERGRGLRQPAGLRAALHAARTRPAGPITRLVEAAGPPGVLGAPSKATSRRPATIARSSSSPCGWARLLNPRWARGEWRKTNLGTIVLFTLVAISGVMVALFVVGPLLLVRARLEDPSGRAGRAPLFRLPGSRLHRGRAGDGPEVRSVPRAPGLRPDGGALLGARVQRPGERAQRPLADERLRRSLTRVLPAVAALVVAYVALLAPVFYGLVHLGPGLRVPVTVLLLAPLGLLLGMPMPAGLRLLAARAPGLGPLGLGRERRGVRPRLFGGRGPRHALGLRSHAAGGRRLLPGRSCPPRQREGHGKPLIAISSRPAAGPWSSCPR